MESLWPLITVVGPIVLIAVLIWATIRNRKASPAITERAERGAREVRDEIRAEEEDATR